MTAPKGKPTGNGYRIMNQSNKTPPAREEYRSDTASSLAVLGAALFMGGDGQYEFQPA
jgi:hypothetical protein